MVIGGEINIDLVCLLVVPLEGQLLRQFIINPISRELRDRLDVSLP